MGNPFRSMGKPRAVGVAVSGDQVMQVARMLLEEHAQSREEATRAQNLVCGNCAGAGQVKSTLADAMIACYACEGTGKPNDKIQALPELTAEDNERLWKLRQLLVKYPKQRGAVLSLIREYFPDMYRDGTAEGAPN